MRCILQMGVIGTLLLGCTTPSTSASDRSIYREIAQRDRARFEANADKLALVGRTECADGYALELYAPPKVSYETALRDSTRTSANAMFWVVRVPVDPPYDTYTLTVPTALDKLGWVASIFEDGEWLFLIRGPKPSAHANVVDTPVIFQQSDVQGDNILPVDLGGILSNLLMNPENRDYRIHFAPFTAVFGGVDCMFETTFWEVELV